MALLARSTTEDVDIEVADEQTSEVVHKMVSLFKKFDTNGDGALSKEELKEVIIELNPPKGLLSPTPEQLEAILDVFMTQMDTNSNGQIEMNEFVAWIHRKPSTAPAARPVAFSDRG
mmetsp:Transcript_71358/g.126073  ORF Transcript_71358/g.126073 Transcript_71358/m.126073 type:complete len:117 (+) Transcript_71358:73-423(+)|eukprot:CAMPEP_0197620144 /NCGR_PEP_ID=MMETSP1338-20131121/1015_1 /TAXON_ID=43686 ORGANISM="Pelagodinium beii, Strain RCC1491" /NCGR_SAMPLE_ID=MMETSP1338 /ASSEMBLY_ACC=CAM_ASM_000754 /LENGTH=116 /DNA_ID=CAMNT_0043189237 /DNA_START=68 /DNA_END=418 /DNA_ORIENTATION=+